MVYPDAIATGEQKPTADACRAQLSRIIESRDFEATARERRFLAHVVEETLAGRADRIKAYSIAVEVFGRDASFDPQNDPIVRIEAAHLRRTLERYYLTAGTSDPVLITIPKGGYAPAFSVRFMSSKATGATEAAGQAPNDGRVWRKASWLTVVLSGLLGAMVVVSLQSSSNVAVSNAPEIPRLLVEQFDALDGSSRSVFLAKGLTHEIIGQLAKFQDIVVVESAEGAEIAALPRYALLGSVSLTGDVFRFHTRLINRRDRSVLWAASYDGGLKVAELTRAQVDVAQNVVTNLAQTYGVIFQADFALDVPNPPDDWAAYSCTLSYYAYRAGVDNRMLPSVRACLEKAVERFPGYATAWALLAQTYIDEVRFSFPFDEASSPAKIERAISTARRAVELDPLNVRALQAEMFGLFFSKELDAAVKVGERALAINPNDTELMGEYGYRLAVSGRWEEGCKLVAQARQRNPGPLAYYESGLALCAYFRGDNAEAVMWIRKTTAPANPIYHAIAAAIYAEAGLQIEARREVDWLETHVPAFLANVQREASIRFGRSGDADIFLGSLDKASLRAGD